MQTYSLKNVLYVCPSCGETAIPASFEKEPIKCKKIGCGGLATQRKCPKCGADIPRTALQTPNLPFSIIGVSNSGKTNYITVMLHELGRASGLRLALGHQNTATVDHQNENYKRIYEDHMPPDSTAGGESMPQIWYIKNLQKKRGNNVPTYTFTIFDGAGEDHEHSLDPASTVCRYIQASKAIIITLDPLILDNIRKGGIVDANVMRNSLAGSDGEHKNAVDVVNSLANYIKTAHGIDVNKILKIPVAVVLTKFDTVKKSFTSNELITSPSMNVRDGKISMEEIRQVDEEIRNWLEKIGESAFIDALASHFKEFYFFGVSSYGEPPENVAKLSERIKPHRVLDPILWLFKRAKFVD
jgi:predicted RNA-binding Zn-ribbon protein involved in translation (DUF1610 family)